MHETPDAVLTTPRFEQQFHYSAEAVRSELATGLLSLQARVEPKFLYDQLGSHLFNAITLVPEYYPTRTEAGIMQRYADDIASHVGEVLTLIDLGAADCTKAEKLFSTLCPQQYVPVDISIDFLRHAVTRLNAAYPALDIIALGQDFSQSLQLPDEVRDENRLFFYPGSSIGNWAPAQAQAMLGRIHAACGDTGSLLIGVDRIKSADILLPAYDDALQVTAAFNRNLLLHLNQLLDSDFHVNDWMHRAHMNVEASCVEMHLEARTTVPVRWPDGERVFEPGQTIHTESSYKYDPDAFTRLLRAAGFGNIMHWTDSQGWFSVFHARA